MFKPITHNQQPNTNNMKILLIEAHSKKNILPALKLAIPKLKEYKKISLVTTVQFVRQLSDAKKLLEACNKIVIINKPKKHAVYEGQILGCDTTSAAKDADCILYIGTGEFHPLGIASDKPVFKLNPFTKQLSKLDTMLSIKKQAARLYKFKLAKTVGILVSSKSGQCNLQANYTDLKTKLLQEGKKVYIFIADTFSPNELMNYPQIDAWVNTACPRIIDDQELFNKLVVNADELVLA